MKISNPCIITPRLLPGVKIGASYISIAYGEATPDNRQGYLVYIDTLEFEYCASDIASKVGGGSLQDGLQAALSFLDACAESRAYHARTGRRGDNADLFPSHVGEWAETNSDEIGMLACELEENAGAIEE